MKTGDGASGRRCVRRILQLWNLTEGNYAVKWHSNIIIMQGVYNYVPEAMFLSFIVFELFCSFSLWCMKCYCPVSVKLSIPCIFM